MKTLKILPGIGILVLTVIGFISTKAQKRSTSIITAGITGVPGLNGATISGLPGNHFTNIKGFGTVAVYIRTAVSNTKIGTLVTYFSTSKKVYYY